MNILLHPDIASLEVGSSEWFVAQREMIRSKPAVESCYQLWYSLLLADVGSVANEGLVVELGSGSSFIKEIYPDVITSDVVPGAVDMVIDGRKLPFEDGSVKALLLTHVFHHIPDVRLFLREAERVLVPGGVVSMIDCAHTPISKVFFGRLHPEPYNWRASAWDFPPGDSMLDSNQALSWMVFERDFDIFSDEFLGLFLEQKSFLPWFSYLLSGGVNLRSIVPPRAANFFEWLDKKLKPIDRFGAIHWHLTVRRR